MTLCCAVLCCAVLRVLPHATPSLILILMMCIRAVATQAAHSTWLAGGVQNRVTQSARQGVMRASLCVQADQCVLCDTS
jgi:hypothetical protein